MGLHLFHNTCALDFSADPDLISNCLPHVNHQQWERQSHNEVDQDLPGLVCLVASSLGECA